jgi:predicted N-formylglutamate amidohydrolase
MRDDRLAAAVPPAVTVLNDAGSSPVVLLCEHASNHIPAEFDQLGLPTTELTRHIAWDIGVAELARQLSAALDAPLFLAGYSRLLIDSNRPIGAPTSIPEISELTVIPGNAGLSAAQRDERAERFYWPFQDAVAAHLDRRQQEGRPTLVIGVHSFTPVFKGVRRPMHGGILFEPHVSIGAEEFVLGAALLAAVQAPELLMEANQPYQISNISDYTVPVHGRARGLPTCLIEIRQDLLADAAGIASWAERLIPALQSVSQQTQR